MATSTRMAIIQLAVFTAILVCLIGIPVYYAYREVPVNQPAARERSANAGLNANRSAEAYLPATAPESATDRDPPRKFATCLAMDPLGRLWQGTETHGVFCYSPDTRQWKRYTTEDGLGDDSAACVAIDKQSRVWVGHYRRGVSVFNQKTWQNYDVLNGPLGFA